MMTWLPISSHNFQKGRWLTSLSPLPKRYSIHLWLVTIIYVLALVCPYMLSVQRFVADLLSSLSKSLTLSAGLPSPAPSSSVSSSLASWWLARRLRVSPPFFYHQPKVSHHSRLPSDPFGYDKNDLVRISF